MNIDQINYMYSSNAQLGFYLAGLIEGDGNIWTSKTLKSPKGRINNPQIVFSFHIKEKPLFAKLKTIFNTGSLYKEKLNNTCKYRVSETKKLIELINLINGKFRTPKIKYLYRAIDHINLVHKTNIKKLPLDNSNIESNSWLAGFTDADGHFQISLEGAYGLNKYLSRGRVKCIFSIKQRVIDKPTGNSCVPFMSKIAELFQCKIIKYKSKNEMTFLAQANSKHYLTKSYFDKYPLMTSKRLDYLCFLQGLNYLDKRLTDQEVIEIQKIKSSMNRNRTYFNWDHLNTLNLFKSHQRP
jgi:LAGLIDADG endonuclease